MKLLPHWSITDLHPAFYDSESATSIEMVAKLYGAMNTLIGEYNKFADSTNVKVEEFMNSTDKNYELFAVGLRQEFQDFIDIINLKVKDQDNKINEAITTISNNLGEYVEKVIDEMRENGELSDVILNAFNDLDNSINELENNFNTYIEENALAINLLQESLINVDENLNKEIGTREQAIQNEAQAREQAIQNEAQAREQAIQNETQERERTDKLLKLPNRLFFPSLVKCCYVKNNITPISMCYNPVREKYTFITATEGKTYIGELKSDKVTVDSYHEISCSHANDITYSEINNKIYIGDLSGTGEIIVVNPSTLSYESKITINDVIGSVGCISCDNKNNEIYIVSDCTELIRVYKLDKDFNILCETTALIPDFTTMNHDKGYYGVLQGSFEDGGTFYITVAQKDLNGMWSGCQILRYDNLNNELITHQFLDTLRGEVEGAYCENGTLYLFSFVDGNYYLCYEFTNHAVKTCSHSRVTYYVDENNELCGDGSENEPANNITQAILNATMFDLEVTIELKSNITKPIKTYNNFPKVININGNDKEIMFDGYVYDTHLRIYNAIITGYLNFAAGLFHMENCTIKGLTSIEVISLYNGAICTSKDTKFNLSAEFGIGIYVRFGGWLNMSIASVESVHTNAYACLNRGVLFWRGTIGNLSQGVYTYEDGFVQTK